MSVQETIHSAFHNYHAYSTDYTDAQLNQLLGVSDPAHEPGTFLQQRRYGFEQFTYEGTPYAYVRHYLHAINPTKDDVIYDLGCGYGKVVFYCALTTQAQAKGIEIVTERVEEAQAIKEKLALSQAEFIRGNVCEQDFHDGTAFFLFNPFSDHAFWWAMDQLHAIASNHSITIATWGGGLTDKFALQDWLEPLSYESPVFVPDLYRLRIYKSTSN